MLAGLTQRAEAQSWGILAGRATSNYWTRYQTNGCEACISGSGPHYGYSRITAGVFLQRRVATSVTLEPALLWLPKGAGQGAQPVLHLRYLEAPLMVQLGPGRRGGPSLRPFLALGPSVGILVSCGLTEAAGANCDSPQQSESKRNRLDFSVVIGAGLEYYLRAGGMFGVDLRYQHSVIDVSPGSGRTLDHVALIMMRWSPPGPSATSPQR